MKTLIIAALTADGFIGRDAKHLADWTGKADKKLFTDVTKAAGIMVMGSRTFETIGRALPGRRTIVYTHRPEEFAGIDSVDTTSEDPARLIAKLRAEGANGVAICGGASIYNMFMAAGVVDELYLTYVGKVFGTGVPLFGDSLNFDLDLLEIKQLDEQTVLLHYAVKK
jgi:dihydrofolate reductase